MGAAVTILPGVTIGPRGLRGRGQRGDRRRAAAHRGGRRARAAVAHARNDAAAGRRARVAATRPSPRWPRSPFAARPALGPSASTSATSPSTSSRCGASCSTGSARARSASGTRTCTRASRWRCRPVSLSLRPAAAPAPGRGGDLVRPRAARPARRALDDGAGPQGPRPVHAPPPRGPRLVYALGGFALSTVNLYVYVQALAWAPAAILGLLRAAARRSARGRPRRGGGGHPVVHHRRGDGRAGDRDRGPSRAAVLRRRPRADGGRARAWARRWPRRPSRCWRGSPRDSARASGFAAGGRPRRIRSIP